MKPKHFVRLAEDMSYRVEVTAEKIFVVYGPKEIKSGRLNDYAFLNHDPYWLRDGIKHGSIVPARCRRAAKRMLGR